MKQVPDETASSHRPSAKELLLLVLLMLLGPSSQ